MKIRDGFVSNSSSSSYLVVAWDGPEDDEKALQAVLEEKYGEVSEWDVSWRTPKDVITMVMDDYDRFKSTEAVWPSCMHAFCGHGEVQFIGLDIVGKIEAGISLEDCKKELKKLIKKHLGLNAKPKEIYLSYGSWGRG